MGILGAGKMNPKRRFFLMAMAKKKKNKNNKMLLLGGGALALLALTSSTTKQKATATGGGDYYINDNPNAPKPGGGVQNSTNSNQSGLPDAVYNNLKNKINSWAYVQPTNVTPWLQAFTGYKPNEYNPFFDYTDKTELLANATGAAVGIYAPNYPAYKFRGQVNRYKTGLFNMQTARKYKYYWQIPVIVVNPYDTPIIIDRIESQHENRKIVSDKPGVAEIFVDNARYYWRNNKETIEDANAVIYPNDTCYWETYDINASMNDNPKFTQNARGFIDPRTASTERLGPPQQPFSFAQLRAKDGTASELFVPAHGYRLLYLFFCAANQGNELFFQWQANSTIEIKLMIKLSGMVDNFEKNINVNVGSLNNYYDYASGNNALKYTSYTTVNLDANGTEAYNY